MTVTGEVIHAIYDDMNHILINVRAHDIGWSVTVIDTCADRIMSRMIFGSRQRAMDHAEQCLRAAHNIISDPPEAFN